jgi:hypothetical protein
MKRRGDRGVPLIENGRTKWTNKWRLDIKIKVCFCPQKRMSPPVPQTVVIGGHAAITEMIKLQFTTITDRIRNKFRNGNWFPKFSINRKEQKFLPICLRLLTLLTIIKDPSLRGLRGNQDRQKFDLWQPQAVKMFAGQ